jgi:hypothetical protein
MRTIAKLVEKLVTFVAYAAFVAGSNNFHKSYKTQNWPQNWPRNWPQKLQSHHKIFHKWPQNIRDHGQTHYSRTNASKKRR